MILMPTINLSLFSPDEIKILIPLINPNNRTLLYYKAPFISQESEYVWMYVVHRLYRDIRFVTPFIPINDIFYNPHPNNSHSTLNLSFLLPLIEKVLTNLEGGFDPVVLEQIQNQRQKD